MSFTRVLDKVQTKLKQTIEDVLLHQIGMMLFYCRNIRCFANFATLILHGACQSKTKSCWELCESNKIGFFSTCLVYVWMNKCISMYGSFFIVQIFTLLFSYRRSFNLITRIGSKAILANKLTLGISNSDIYIGYV